MAGNLKRIREASGRRQDDVAAEARRLGLTWTRSTVAALETGRRELKIEELVALPVILGSALGKPVTALDLYACGDAISLTPAVALSTQELARALSGQRVSVRWLVDEERQRLIDEELPELADILSGFDDATVERALVAGRGEAEAKAAGSLGVLPGLVGAVAVHLWGRSLSDERDARAGSDGDARSLQARRGHATRALLAELRDELARRGLEHR